MTLEEAKKLKAGDIISCCGNNNRVTTRVWFSETNPDCLFWWQEGMREIEHRYEIDKIDLVKAAEPVVVNNYPIY